MNSDFFMRKGILHLFYSDELLNCSLELFPMLKENLVQMLPESDARVDDFLDLLTMLLSMVSFSNQRAYHGIIAAMVANKYGMRNYMLNKFEAPPTTAEFLKSTNFTSDEVFGEIYS